LKKVVDKRTKNVWKNIVVIERNRDAHSRVMVGQMGKEDHSLIFLLTVQVGDCIF